MIKTIKIATLTMLSLWIAGCTNNPWVSMQTKESGAISSVEQESTSRPYVRDRDLNWEGVVTGIVAGSAEQQKAVIGILEGKLKTNPSDDLKLRLAFVLGFAGEKVRNQTQALTLYKEIPEQKLEQLASKMLPGLASVMLGELQANKGRIWWLKQDIDRLQSEKEETAQHVQMLESKLRAIKSIEESIHQRNR